MKLVEKEITIDELSNIRLVWMSQKMFGNLIKAVVDIKKGIMVVDSGLHSDEEDLLLENGSSQEDLWGINIYPENINTEGWIEFDSMINLKPSQGNMSISVDNQGIREKIVSIVDKLVKK